MLTTERSNEPTAVARGKHAHARIRRIITGSEVVLTGK